MGNSFHNMWGWHKIWRNDCTPAWRTKQINKGKISIRRKSQPDGFLCFVPAYSSHSTVTPEFKSRRPNKCDRELNNIPSIDKFTIPTPRRKIAPKCNQHWMLASWRNVYLVPPSLDSKNRSTIQWEVAGGEILFWWYQQWDQLYDTSVVLIALCNLAVPWIS